MPVTCPSCQYDRNSDGAKFCEACGCELEAAFPPYPMPGETINIEPPAPPPIYPRSGNTINIYPPSPPPMYSVPVAPPPPPPVLSVERARLIAKQAGYPIQEFALDGSNAIIGRFDQDTGPVDIDLDGFPGDQTVSRNHGEIYREGGLWKIRDIGSENGIFIKRAGQTRFSARITAPEILSPGDEIAIAKIRFLFESP